MKKLWLAFSLLLCACANSRISYAMYDSTTLGISFEYPESWALKPSAAEINVATDESLFAVDTADFSGGAVANFSTLPVEAVNGDVEMALAQFTSFVAAREGVEQTGNVDLFTVDGREAAQAKVNLTETATLLVVMIEEQEQVILVAAVYDAAQYEEMMVHLVESIRFNE